MGDGLLLFLKAAFPSIHFVLNYRTAGDKQNAVFISKVRGKVGPYYLDETYSITAADVIPATAMTVANECYLLLLNGNGFTYSGKKAHIKNQTGPVPGGMDANGISVVQFSCNFISKR